MAFSFACEKAGFATTTVDTRAKLRRSAQGQGFVIDRIAPSLQAVVPGLDEAQFQALAASAKRDCPLSKALASVPEISCSGTLRRWRCTRTPNWRRKAAEAAAAQGQFGPIASTLTRCRPP